MKKKIQKVGWGRSGDMYDVIAGDDADDECAGDSSGDALSDD